jgi:VIT1/CCC1 family predicted Fe2+/Mn2+ transporter
MRARIYDLPVAGSRDGAGSDRGGILPRLDGQTVRAHLVDVNDGVIATAGVVEGLLAAGASVTTVVVAALGAMVGGGVALGGMKYSEAADERDAELAVLAEERRLHELQPEEELAELAALYEDKGLSPALARQVAEELSTTDALLHHAEVEHGITIGDDSPTPVGTAVLAGLGFMVGAAVPLAVSALVPAAWRIAFTVLAVVAALCGTATLVARLGGMRVGRTVLRTVAIGLLTMLLTLAGGALFDL